jgi:hypothetical protein
MLARVRHGNKGRTAEGQAKYTFPLLTLACPASTPCSGIGCIGQLLLLGWLNYIHGHTHSLTQFSVFDSLFDTLYRVWIIG